MGTGIELGSCTASQSQVLLVRTLPGSCAGLCSPLCPRVQERPPRWPQQQGRETGWLPRQHCPPGGAGPTRSFSLHPRKLPDLGSAGLSPPGSVPNSSPRSGSFPPRLAPFVSTNLPASPSPPPLPPLPKLPAGGGGVDSPAPRRSLRRGPRLGFEGRRSGRWGGVAEGGAGRGGMCTVTSAVCPAPRGLALALSLLCLLLRGPQGLIWSPGTGQPGSKGRGEIRRGERGPLPARAPGKGGRSPPAPLAGLITFHSLGEAETEAPEKAFQAPSFPAPGSRMCQDEAGVDCARTALCSRPPWVLQGCGGRCCRGPLSTPCAQATPAWHTHPAGRGETSREPLPQRSTGRGWEGKPGRLMQVGGRRPVSLPHCPQRLLRPLPPP